MRSILRISHQRYFQFEAFSNLSSRADFSYRAWDGYVLRFHTGKDAIWPLCLPEIQSLKAVNGEKE
ncbi:hypothetical protein ALQ53_103264 [Pseudomonas cannabina]|uniref:Uncharacterized protein n=1 Tax=Pseudomonas cannabina TaxID=86840 RepID=A0A3M3QRR7_PSECA|nr:hypothetical protein ALQ53_103264 [Pseudomonas cannabina]RMN86690.1 hypothetical protein ALQ51_02192 [Pseudomonas cannabina]